MKKSILLGISVLLVIIATAIPFCIIAAVNGPLDTAQKMIAGILSVIGYVAAVLYFQLYKAVNRGPERF